MGQQAVCPCSAGNGDRALVTEQCVRSVKSVKLPPDAAEPLLEVQKSLQEAVKLWREGRRADAAVQLRSAEKQLSELTRGGSGYVPLLEAYEEDPELDPIKNLVRNSPLIACATGVRRSTSSEAVPGTWLAIPVDITRQADARRDSTELGWGWVPSTGIGFEMKTPRILREDTEHHIANFLEDAYDRVQEYCRRAELFEAEKLLDQMFASSIGIDGWSERLAEPKLQKVLRVTARMAGLIEQVNRASVSGEADPHDAKWAKIFFHEKQLGPEFSCDFKIRFAEGSDMDPDGPSTQLIAYSVFKNVPMPFSHYMATLYETDLYQREWVTYCKSITGRPGGKDKLWSAYMRLLLAPKLLPKKFEQIQIREFAVCPEVAPLVGQAPGVLMIETNPPNEHGEFEGWPLPAPEKGCLNLQGYKLWYFSPNLENPKLSNAIVFARGGAPLPRWMIPLGLIKRIFADFLTSSLMALKNNIIDHWDALTYKERILAEPDFYTVILNIEQCSGRTPTAANSPDRTSPCDFGSFLSNRDAEDQAGEPQRSADPAGTASSASSTEPAAKGSVHSSPAFGSDV